MNIFDIDFYTLFKFQVKIQGQNEEMLLAACEQFLSKNEEQIQQVALETLEGHQRAIMGSMTVEVGHFWKSSIFLSKLKVAKIESCQKLIIVVNCYVIKLLSCSIAKL